MRNLINSSYRRFSAPDTAFIVVIGHARTGTNLLCSLLNSNPSVTCAYEVLHATDAKIRQKFHREMVEPTEAWLRLSPGQEHREAVEYIESRLIPKASAGHPFGFKILYSHIQTLRLYTYFARHNYKFLHLTRNPVEVYVSFEQAQQTGQWYLGKGEPRHQTAPPVEVDPARLTAFLRSYRNQVDRHNRINPLMLSVDYADLCNHRQQVMDQVFGFLDVPSAAVDTHSCKQQPWKIRDRISNFEFLLQQLPKDVRAQVLELAE